MVYMFLADGFEETEALAPLDILRRGGVEVQTVGVTGGYVTGAHGITVKADILPPIALKDNTEAVILPGGGVGTQNLDASVLVKEAVQSAYSSGKLICAICAAPSVLGKMGLLRGKKATCYPGFEKYLDGAELSEANVAESGNVITANGMGAALDFGFAVLARLRGADKAEEVKRQIQY